MYDNLFSPKKIGSKTSVNRFFSQAMEGNDGENGGKPSERTLARYEQIAKGKWGCSVVEAISVVPESLARTNGLVMSKENLPYFKRLVEVFRKYNPDGILLFQLTHSGRNSGLFSKRTMLYDDGLEGAKLLATDEIDRIRDSFIAASALAEETGIDGIDFKLCHGYLGGEILRPANVRDDKWGGSFENRTRFIREIMQGIRAKQKSKDFILGSRLSFFEAIRGGCGTDSPDGIIEDLTETEEVVRLLETLGADYVNVSAGIPAQTPDVTRPVNSSKYLYLNHFRYARIAKKATSKIAVVGSAYSVLKENALDLGDENVKKGYVDFVGFGRQSFADPLFPEKVKSGGKVNFCVACSGCSKLMAKQMNDGCIIYNDYYKEQFKAMNK
jgi:2,4-dienoyl-CoA reductase-like NADH-dependent reductase (Old Yellow Enzyme family)